MAPKLRTKDRHLPTRMHYKHGAYYYVTRENKWIFLSRDFHEAIIKWSEIVNKNKSLNSMNQIFDRYLIEIAPKKAPRTYKDNIKSIGKLRVPFGDMSPEDITPVEIYGYLDERGKVGKRAANIEKSVLSHVFSYAIRWGAVKDNPCRNVKRLTEKKRDRYITDKEFLAVKEFASEFIGLAMVFAYLTALRMGDILALKLTDITEDGIEVKTNKTGSKIIIEWSEELKSCVEQIKALPRPIRGMYLFCTRRGQPYTSSGFKSPWQRTIRKAHELGLVEERFRFHDIRRKAATDAEKNHGREYARQLLGHETQAMTAHYISGQQRVKPVK